jgi:hypothetical protein
VVPGREEVGPDDAAQGRDPRGCEEDQHCSSHTVRCLSVIKSQNAMMQR